jgi:hypothetical protein
VRQSRTELFRQVLNAFFARRAEIVAVQIEHADVD